MCDGCGLCVPIHVFLNHVLVLSAGPCLQGAPGCERLGAINWSLVDCSGPDTGPVAGFWLLAVTPPVVPPYGPKTDV